MNREGVKIAVGRRFARFVTDVVVRRPALWRPLRPLLRKQFDALAPRWEQLRDAQTFAPYEAALAAIREPPKRALDVGTGTGAGAFILARRFPEAEVVGADLSEKMLVEARKLTPPDLDSRVRFERVDAARLPYADASFDLVALANMIPFFDELARVVRPGGSALVAFSSGPETPIYVPADRLRTELGQRGFTEFAEFDAGRGNALLARKAQRS